MFDKLLFANRIQKLLKQGNIEIVHFIPGRLRLKSPGWVGKQGAFEKFITYLSSDPLIISTSYTPETGSFVIAFDPVLTEGQENRNKLEAWLREAEKITMQL